MPHADDLAIDAEKALLSDLLRHPHALSEVAETLTPQDFLEPSHHAIYENMIALTNAGKSLGYLTLIHQLKDAEVLDKIGSETYLLSIIDPDAAYNIGSSASETATIVKTASQKRTLAQLGQEIAMAAQPRTPESPDDILGMLESQIFRISQDTAKANNSVQVYDIFANTIESMYERGEAEEGSVFGVPTGFEELDSRTTGFHGGQFIIVAARPGVGKSTLAVDFARNAAYRAGKSIMFFSLEMSQHELLERILAAETHVELEKIKTGKLEVDDWREIQGVQDAIMNASFVIDDSPNTTITQIRTKALRQKNAPEGLDMIVLDYIQLMRSSGKVESRQQEVSDFSRSLKLLAKELDVPVIALSQLNRGSENRGDKRPMISDLRESGSLEQDADIVMLIHRPEVSDPNDHPGQAELILAKNRQGSTGVINLTPLLVFSKFTERGRYEVPDVAPEEDAELREEEVGIPDFDSADAPPPPVNLPEYAPRDEDIPDEETMPAW